MRDALESIVARLEAATGPDIELNADICIAVSYIPNIENPINVRRSEWFDDDPMLDYELNNEPCCDDIPFLTSSIDAGAALAASVLPTWSYFLDSQENAATLFPPRWPFDESAEAAHKSMPIALCLALCRALLAQQAGETAGAANA